MSPLHCITRELVLVSLLLFSTAVSPQSQTDAIDYTRLLQPQANAEPARQFLRVMAPMTLRFPEDHGAHPDYRLEWWYITGNLSPADEADKQNRWGFQLTFFRLALHPPGESDTPTLWHNPQLYLAHFAITDRNLEEHFKFERLSREGAGLAGVKQGPLRVWLDNWRLEALQHDTLFPARLSALASDNEAGIIALELTLQNGKPLVLQGERGFSAKSATPGNASLYYSYTRIGAAGSIQIGDFHGEVTGSAWLDREWSSSGLDADQQGWDWFALQLADGRELMFYRLRRDAATPEAQMDPFSRGVLVETDGSHTPILPADIELIPQSYWRSPAGINYPLHWRLRLPKWNMDLSIAPLIQDQEWRQRLRYWEGAVIVSGSHAGRGYLELAGYR